MELWLKLWKMAMFITQLNACFITFALIFLQGCCLRSLDVKATGQSISGKCWELEGDFKFNEHQQDYEEE